MVIYLWFPQETGVNYCQLPKGAKQYLTPPLEEAKVTHKHIQK